MPEKKNPPIHPGEILFEEFLEPLGLIQYRLARYFGTTDRFWLNLQARYDIELEKNLIPTSRFISMC